MSDVFYIYVIASIVIAAWPAMLTLLIVGDWRAVAFVFVGYAILWPVVVAGGAICCLVTEILAAVNRFKLDRWLRSQGL